MTVRRRGRAVLAALVLTLAACGTDDGTPDEVESELDGYLNEIWADSRPSAAIERVLRGALA